MKTKILEIQTVQQQCNFKVLCKVEAAEGPLSDWQLLTNHLWQLNKTETSSIEDNTH